MSDLHSKAGKGSREQRRHSSTEFIETASFLSTIPRHKILTGPSTGTWRRVRQTFIPEGEKVVGRVRNPPAAFPNSDSNRSYRPPPKRPFVPTFEQLQLSRKAKDEEIERFLRPKKAPLPPRLPLEDEAYVDVILTKRGAVSKTGREQVADKDIARLRPHQWLNDEIINFYGQLILSRSEGQKENLTSTPVDGHINGLINGLKGKGKGKAKAIEKKPLLDVHYFNTFFWPKLTGEGYDKGRLAKWTKKVTFNPTASVHRIYSFPVSASSTCSRRR